jgi:type IV pilus assembly protein PilM
LLSSANGFGRGIYRNPLVRRLARWLDAPPHPPIACEISAARLAGVRFTRGGAVDDLAIESLPPGAIVPSAVEPNLANAGAVKTALRNVLLRLRAQEQDVALLLPDPVIRVFIQRFEQFPRAAKDALPMLRWKLKKSIPFDADETQISFMRQPSALEPGGVDVVTALARQRILREYETLVEEFGAFPGVVLSSSLAALSLLADQGPALLARLSGTSLATAIVRDGILCGYRCTELPEDAHVLRPETLIEEIFPVAAYYQDTWKETIQTLRISGLGLRLDSFAGPLQKEFGCPVRSLLASALSAGLLGADAKALVDNDLDGLAGWKLQRG